MANFQNNIMQEVSNHAAFVPPAKAAINSVDFKTFFLQMYQQQNRFARAMAITEEIAENLGIEEPVLEMPEYGIYAIGPQKRSPGTLFAAGMHMQKWGNVFELALSSYLSIGELQDKANELFRSGLG